MALPRAVIVTRPSTLSQAQGRYGSVGSLSFNVRNSDDLLEATDSYAAVASAATGTRSSQVSYEEGKRRFRNAGSLRSVQSSNRTFNSLQQSHQQFSSVHSFIAGAIPSDWRVARVDRADLAQFLFQPDDVVIVVGQDGLVANVAKYLEEGQPVIGINPEPAVNPGILVPWEAAAFPKALKKAMTGEGLEERTLVEAVASNGQVLRALNEIFIGHRSHQSARYTLEYNAEGQRRTERQSSSGVIVFTGTGATGWAASCLHAYQDGPDIPNIADHFCSFFVREPWASPAFGDTIRVGTIRPNRTKEGHLPGLVVRSEIEVGGVVFGDGIEDDSIDFGYGSVVAVAPSEQKLRLVTPT